MKNLRVTGITHEKDPLVYITHTQIIDRMVHNDVFFWGLQDYNFLKYVAEYSNKQAIVKFLIQGVQPRFTNDDIIVSDGLAKKLGITVGDEITLKIKLFRKPDDDYLVLYEKNPKKFIKYFNKQNETEKKKILKELLEYDKTNEEVVSWLDKHESKLIREVGLE